MRCGTGGFPSTLAGGGGGGGAAGITPMLTMPPTMPLGTPPGTPPATPDDDGGAAEGGCVWMRRSSVPSACTANTTLFAAHEYNVIEPVLCVSNCAQPV